jgi:peptide/nickel transport system permease protein
VQISPILDLQHRSERLRFWTLLFQDKLAVLGLLIVVVVAVGALGATLIAPYNPITPHYADRLAAPTTKYLLGTDDLGRDILSRLLYGARVSLSIAFIAQGIAMSAGLIVGFTAGWYGGWVDDLLMRLTDIFFAIPALLFLIVWVTIFGRNPVNIFLALGTISWPGNARIIRSQVLAIKEREFITTAKAVGVPTFRIWWAHILPNAASPLIALATLGIGGAILSEAILSYLGLGIEIPNPSWGTMVDLGQGYMTTAWWYPVFPGLLIMITVMGFNFLGDGIRNAIDPRR